MGRFLDSQTPRRDPVVCTHQTPENHIASITDSIQTEDTPFKLLAPQSNGMADGSFHLLQSGGGIIGVVMRVKVPIDTLEPTLNALTLDSFFDEVNSSEVAIGDLFRVGESMQLLNKMVVVIEPRHDVRRVATRHTGADNSRLENDHALACFQEVVRNAET